MQHLLSLMGLSSSQCKASGMLPCCITSVMCCFACGTCAHMSNACQPHIWAAMQHFSNEPACVQIFNLEMKSKMKSFQIQQPVVFWKWISPSKLGLVTASSVYHWDMNVRAAALASRWHQAACAPCMTAAGFTAREVVIT